MKIHTIKLIDFKDQYTKSKDKLELSVEEELDRRYQFTMQNPEIGKSWEEVRDNLINKNLN